MDKLRTFNYSGYDTKCIIKLIIKKIIFLSKQILYSLVHFNKFLNVIGVTAVAGLVCVEDCFMSYILSLSIYLYNSPFIL